MLMVLLLGCIVARAVGVLLRRDGTLSTAAAAAAALATSSTRRVMSTYNVVMSTERVERR